MNKFEFQRRLEEGEELIADGKFEEAVEVLDQLDLAMIDQPRRLQNIAKAYEKAKRYEDAEDILLDAREFAPKSRAITFHLCTVALKAGELKEAKEYYEDFLKIGARDPQRFVLQYRIAEAEKRPDEELMEILETFRKEEPDDRWMFQLASLYAQHGRYDEAIDVCNSIDLWFFNGKYVKMARELRDQLGAQGPDYARELAQIRKEEERKAAEAAEKASVYSAPEESDETVNWMGIDAAGWTGEQAEPVKTAAEETAEAVPGAVEETEKTVRNAVEETAEAVKDAAEEAAETVKGVVEETEEAVNTVSPVIAKPAAVVEEEDVMFDFSYSSKDAETVKETFAEETEDAWNTFAGPVKKVEEKAEEVRTEEKLPFTIDLSLPKKEEPEEDRDEHVVFSVTGKKKTAAEDVKDAAEDVKNTAEEAVSEARGALEDAGEDLGNEDFDFEFDPKLSFGDEEEEEDEDDSFGKRPAFVAPKPEPKAQEEPEPDEDDEEDDEDEEDEPVRKKARKPFFAKLKRNESFRFEEEDDEDDEDEEPDLETLALQAAIRRREEDSKLFGDLPIDPDVTKDLWHFLVHAKTPELSLECAREKLRELMEANPNCPTKMLKISAEKIGGANIINSLDRFLNNMVIVEGAGKLSDRQLSDFAKVLNKDDRALLLVFTDTKEELVKMFEREPALKDSFTAVFEGRRFNAADLMQVAKTYLYQEDAKLTESGEAYLADYIDRLLAEGKGFYRTNVISLTEDALEISEKGGFLGLAMGKVDADGFLAVTGKHFRKAENLG